MNSEEKPGAPDLGRAPGGDKLMHTFRLPRELVLYLKAEASLAGRDLTGHVVRCLEGIRTYFGLPGAATSLLEEDRRRLGMDRHEYLLHLLYQRSIQLREEGPGFDAPRSERAAGGGPRGVGQPARPGTEP